MKKLERHSHRYSESLGRARFEFWREYVEYENHYQYLKWLSRMWAEYQSSDLDSFNNFIINREK